MYIHWKMTYSSSLLAQSVGPYPDRRIHLNVCQSLIWGRLSIQISTEDPAPSPSTACSRNWFENRYRGRFRDGGTGLFSEMECRMRLKFTAVCDIAEMWHNGAITFRDPSISMGTRGREVCNGITGYFCPSLTRVRRLSWRLSLRSHRLFQCGISTRQKMFFGVRDQGV